MGTFFRGRGGEKVACLLSDLDELRTSRGNRPDHGARTFLLQALRQRDAQCLDVSPYPLPYKGYAVRNV